MKRFKDINVKKTFVFTYDLQLDCKNKYVLVSEIKYFQQNLKRLFYVVQDPC